MSFLMDKDKKFVRIKIGNCETGHKNLMAPIKTINVRDLSVDKVKEIIEKALEKELKKRG